MNADRREIGAALKELFASADAARKEPATPAEPLPQGLEIQGACGTADLSIQQQLQAAASARIPLVQGLTLSSVWIREAEGSFEHECLIQVIGIDARGISVTQSCNRPNGTRYGGTRVICGTDFDAARYYHPGWFTPRYPEAVRGSTMFTLPVAAFRHLQASGSTPYRYAEVNTNPNPPVVVANYAGTIERREKTTFDVIVNDQIVHLPVINVRGKLSGTNEVTVEARILDDERFPIVLDYRHPERHYALTYSKISFPNRNIESRLAQDEPVDVYGVYFDFASDRLRPESTPVLDEIAQVLGRHPDWKLRIAGHTDSVGGASANLDLSKRRAAAVREALVTHYAIDTGRLSTTGAGASSPKDTNDTVEGRARNRRVELTRER